MGAVLDGVAQAVADVSPQSSATECDSAVEDCHLGPGGQAERGQRKVRRIDLGKVRSARLRGTTQKQLAQHATHKKERLVRR